MGEKSAVYNEVNRKWKATCRVLLGGEVGELDDFADWLYDYNGPRRVEKSIKSGKPVVSYDGRYSKGARWLSLDEVDFSAKPAALGINGIKDIDSILQGISEQVVYAGNINLGNSTGIEDSTTVMDSHFICHSESAWEAKYVAYTSHVIGECIFGGHCSSGNFLIRCNNFLCDRCFEIAKCDLCSGIYYSHGLSACHDCMFSFSLRAKRNCIGNLQLSKEKYAELKQTLVSEIREKLKTKHKLPHLIDLFKGEKPDYAPMQNALAKWRRAAPPKTSKDAIENAFTKTCELIFGVPYQEIDKYAAWLKRNTRRFEECKSCASGLPLPNPDYADFLRFPRDRLLSFDEAEEAAQRLALGESEVESLCLQNAGKALSRLAYFSPEWKTGNNANNIDCPLEIDCTDCYRCIINIGSKRCAYGWWPRNSEHLFGFNRVRQSAFCINTFDSEKIQRCFEVSEARGSSDCYYCHNIENCTDCLFCFNAKNLKCAVGNIQLPREKYLEIKKRVLAQLNEEIARTDSIELSIFNLPDSTKAKAKRQ
ncbi:MAG: hypothetical protein WC861_04730 [Candidatus Micrarchaeia archaeon]